MMNVKREMIKMGFIFVIVGIIGILSEITIPVSSGILIYILAGFDFGLGFAFISYGASK